MDPWFFGLLYKDPDPSDSDPVRILVLFEEKGNSMGTDPINQSKSIKIIYFEQSRHSILLTFMEIDVKRHEYEHNSTNFLQFYCINNTLISVRRRQVSHRLCLVLGACRSILSSGFREIIYLEVSRYERRVSSYGISVHYSTFCYAKL
jgi:hypothetical protein